MFIVGPGVAFPSPGSGAMVDSRGQWYGLSPALKTPAFAVTAKDFRAGMRRSSFTGVGGRQPLTRYTPNFQASVEQEQSKSPRGQIRSSV